MIKLKSLLEGLTLRNYDLEIEKLRKEWDRLDNMGGMDCKQRKISAQIYKLQKEKEKWEKLYKAAL
jgi:hypothetical protein